MKYYHKNTMRTYSGDSGTDLAWLSHQICPHLRSFYVYHYIIKAWSPTASQITDQKHEVVCILRHKYWISQGVAKFKRAQSVRKVVRQELKHLPDSVTIHILLPYLHGDLGPNLLKFLNEIL